MVKDFNDYQEESQKAKQEAERMWAEALAAFVAGLKQAQACAEDSRKAAAEERLDNKAKALIEQWDNNQNLYFDSINNVAVVYELALKRAKQYIESDQMGEREGGFQFAALPLAANDPSPAVAALRELELAIASLIACGLR